MLGDDPYSVNDEGMKEGNTYQVKIFIFEVLEMVNQQM